MKLSLPQLVALAAKHGFPDPELAAAIAMAESGGDSCAQGDPNVGTHPCSGPNGSSKSFGLWQVDTEFNKYDATSLLDPDFNADAAFKISSSGVNWRPWSTAWENPFYAGYLGARAPFRPYYHSVWQGQRLVPPSASPSAAPALLVAVALAAAAGYAATHRWEYVR